LRPTPLLFKQTFTATKRAIGRYGQVRTEEAFWRFDSLISLKKRGLFKDAGGQGSRLPSDIGTGSRPVILPDSGIHFFGAQ
jgi:hypothetical protein